MYEAVGTSAWTGTPLAPLIARAVPKAEVVEIAFEGLDFGYDKGVGHAFGRSLTLDQIAELDVLVVWAMNGADLLPQHVFAPQSLSTNKTPRTDRPHVQEFS